MKANKNEYILAPIVLVEWKDATTYGDNFTMEEIKELICGSCKTIGFLLEKNKEYIKICGHIYKKVDGSCTYTNIWIIPRPWVLRIISL